MAYVQGRAQGFRLRFFMRPGNNGVVTKVSKQFLHRCLQWITTETFPPENNDPMCA